MECIKRILLHSSQATFLLAILLMIQGCGGHDNPASNSSSSSSSSSSNSSSSGSGSSSSGIIQPPEWSDVHGRILDIAGRSIDEAEISVHRDGTAASMSAVSAVDGTFNLTLEAEKDYVLHIQAAGFADQVVAVKSPDADGQISIDATLIARAEPITISDNSRLTHTGNDGATVTVSKADFVDVAGNPVEDDIQLTITPVDVSNPAAVAAFPGRFAGVIEGEAVATPIVSLGVAEYEFAVDGQPVNLAPGASAEIVVPINVATYPDGTAIAIGDSIPLWSLNETTGIWIQEGQGTVIASAASSTGIAFQATVSHFSWWNCDIPTAAAYAEIVVLGDAQGNATIFAKAPGLVNWGGEKASTTVSVGETSAYLTIPTGIEICFHARIAYDNHNFAITDQVCFTASEGEVVPVTLGAPSEGPLDIQIKPKTQGEDAVQISALKGQAIAPYELFPVSAETSVSYEITSGHLPDGMSLDTSGNRARIVGIPAVEGSFSFIVTATDSDGFTDEVVFDYVIGTFNPANQLLLSFDRTACGFNRTFVYINKLELWTGDATIDWGDGTIEMLNSLRWPPQHSYADERVKGSILITFTDGIEALKTFRSRSDSETSSCFTFDLSAFSNASELLTFYFHGPNRITGDFLSLPKNLRSLSISNSLVKGNVADVPRSVTELKLVDNGIASGDLADLPPSLKTFWVDGRPANPGGVNTITGNIGDIPASVTSVKLDGNNTVSGDISDIPRSATSIHIGGNNTVYGDLSSIPRSAYTIDIRGINTVSGNILSIPRNANFFYLWGENTATGDITNIYESLSTIDIRGNNTVFGDLAHLNMGNAMHIHFGGNNRIDEFDLTPSWDPSNHSLSVLSLNGKSALDSGEVDRLLSFLSDRLPVSGYPNSTIEILGSNAPRTSASDSAVSILEDKKYSVITNEGGSD